MHLVLQFSSGLGDWSEVFIGLMIILLLLRFGMLLWRLSMMKQQRRGPQNKQSHTGPQQPQSIGGEGIGAGQPPTPEQILKRRLAKGEITREQYEQMVAVLKK